VGCEHNLKYFRYSGQGGLVLSLRLRGGKVWERGRESLTGPGYKRPGRIPYQGVETSEKNGFDLRTAVGRGVTKLIFLKKNELGLRNGE